VVPGSVVALRRLPHRLDFGVVTAGGERAPAMPDATEMTATQAHMVSSNAFLTCRPPNGASAQATAHEAPKTPVVAPDVRGRDGCDDRLRGRDPQHLPEDEEEDHDRRRRDRARQRE
jgi:hypothetical protein